MSQSTLQKAALFNQLFEPKLSHGSQKMLQLIDGAIECYARCGIDGVTMDEIAKECDVSRPLIIHYFKNKQELFNLVVKRIRLNFQGMAITAIQKAETPTARIKAYVHSTFDWTIEYPSHIKVWMLYIAQCSSHPDDRDLNTDLVRLGHERITALLEEGVEKGEFESGSLEWRAKLIQLIISGALISVASEKILIPMERLRRHTVDSCLNIAKSK